MLVPIPVYTPRRVCMYNIHNDINTVFMSAFTLNYLHNHLLMGLCSACYSGIIGEEESKHIVGIDWLFVVWKKTFWLNFVFCFLFQEQPDSHGTGGPPPTNKCSIVIHSSAGSSQDYSMATLEADLKKQILGRPKAEKAFRPWWDTLEDYLLNSLVLLGTYVYVVEIISWTDWHV